MPVQDIKGTIYGPVNSWRLGLSLGVDLLFIDSICSFRCVYCQLGKINRHTSERQIYVSTRQVISDIRASDWQDADVVTFSGSGEPTLAANLGEVISEVKEITGKPVAVLTNSAHLSDSRVRRDLAGADKVFCKLDAADEETFKRVNRPLSALTLKSVVEGIRSFSDEFRGFLAVQTMYSFRLKRTAQELGEILVGLDPDEVQLNTVSRDIPVEWFLDARGNYDETPYPAISPRTIPDDEILDFASLLKELTGLEVVTRLTNGH